jgi:transcriptional regulator with XRE-family HTH domain
MVNKLIDYKAIGKQIQKRRKQLGLSQNASAEKLDLSTSFYARMERGEKAASLETLIKVANCFEVSVDLLLQDTLNYNVSDRTRAEITQILADKNDKQAKQLLKWCKMLSKNIDNL